MDKKKKLGPLPKEDLKGFEEFMEDKLEDASTQRTIKNDSGFESYNFLEKDSRRLAKIKDLMSQKIPFLNQHDQSEKLINEQKMEIEIIKNHLKDIFKHPQSGFRKSLREVFDSFFGPTKN
jgi:hypothetical protein